MCACVLDVCLPSWVLLPTRFRAWSTSDTSPHSTIYCETTLMKTVTRPVSSTTQLFLLLLWYFSTKGERDIWLGWSVMNQKTNPQTKLCVQHTRRHHMDGRMHAHTMNANMSDHFKEDKVFLQLNWNPRLQSQLPHHYLWLICQTLSSSSLRFSLCRISFASKKITKWYYFLRPFNLPFPSAIPPMTYRRIFPILLSTSPASVIFIISLFHANFHPLSFKVHISILFHKTNTSLTYCTSKFLRDSGGIFDV